MNASWRLVIFTTVSCRSFTLFSGMSSSCWQRDFLNLRAACPWVSAQCKSAGWTQLFWINVSSSWPACFIAGLRRASASSSGIGGSSFSMKTSLTSCSFTFPSLSRPSTFANSSTSSSASSMWLPSWILFTTSNSERSFPSVTSGSFFSSFSSLRLASDRRRRWSLSLRARSRSRRSRSLSRSSSRRLSRCLSWPCSCERCAC
mmetsp:Transcript_102517/g.270812  ORF Transcript_102517/g.270812 Transcript_102517/m.270812 type:complete len:203 (+) Transcript_102517:657-1265(+)